MQKTSKFLGLKVGIGAAMSFFMAAALVLVATPRVINKAHADLSCFPTYNQPIFNPYTISNDGTDCTDYSFMAARVNGGSWQPDNGPGQNIYVNAQPGDTVEFQLYVHNGEVVGGAPATGIRLSTSVDGNTSSSHSVSAQVTANNTANSLSGTMYINTGSGTHLEVVPGSERWMQKNGSWNDLSGLVNNTVSMPDQQACFEFVRFIEFSVKIVGTTQPSQPSGNGTLSASANNTCPPSIHLNWTNSNVGGIAIFDQTGRVIPGSASFNGNVDDTGVQAGQTYNYELWNVNWVGSQPQKIGNQPLATASASIPANVCQQASSVICTPATQTTNVNQTVSFTASGGTQPYYWTAVGSSNPYQNNTTSFQTQYTQTGQQTVTVTDSTGQHGYCTVTVNGAQQQSASITASLGNQVAGQCLWTARISWTTTNVNNVRVYVKSSSQPTEQLFAADISGDRTVNWIGAGDYVTFILRGDNIPDRTAFVDARDKTCAVQPPPPAQLICQATSPTSVNVGQAVSFSVTGGQAPYQLLSSGGQVNGLNVSFPTPGTYSVTARDTAGQQVSCGSVTVTQQQTPVVSAVISASLGSQISGQCLWNGNVTWNTTNVNNVRVYVKANNNIEQLFAADVSGNRTVNWVGAGDLVTFILRGDNIPDKTAVIDARNLSCAQPPVVCILNSPSTVNGSAVAPSDLVSYSVQNPVSGQQYNWSANSAAPASGQGSNFSTRFNPGVPTGSVSVNGFACPPVAINIPQTPPPPQPPVVNGGTCNGSSNSCNNNQNDNHQISYGNNSANQNNQSNINGNNNTVTQTNNNCVNNSCNTNTFYYYTAVSNPSYPPIPVPANEYRQLSITKAVRNMNFGSGFQKTVSAGNGDVVQFQVVITNSGNVPVNNVVLTDGGSNGLQWVSGSTQFNSSGYNNGYYGGYGNNNLSWYGNNLNLGNLAVGQSVTVTFQARINAPCGVSIQNVASVTGDGVPQRQDDAWVFLNQCGGSVQGGNVSLTYSKRAWNDSKNVDATTQPASKEDFITYTLTVTNTGNTPAPNFVITDDLSQVLPYADMADNGGGSVSGNVITYPGITVPAGGSVSRSFRVRVKYFLADNLNYTMTNTYGNTVVVNINAPRVAGAFIAPKTGADTNAFAFAGLMVAAFAIVKKREYVKAVMKLIFT